MKKFPLLRVTVACFVMFASGFSIMMVFAFQPFMVNAFFPDLNKEELGWKTGYLGLTYFLGNFVGGFIWGWLADNWGRRPCVLLGIIGSVTFITCFGLSKTFFCAVATRFGWGLVNCSFGVVINTYLSEILDDSQQAKGFSIFGISIGMARILGPVFGGFFSQPAEKYEMFDVPLFCDNPFVLPILISDSIFVISFIGVYFVFEETLKTSKCNSREEEPMIKELPHEIENDADTSSDEDYIELYSNSDVDYQRLNKITGCYDRLRTASADTCKHLIHVQRQQLTCITNCLVCAGGNCRKNQVKNIDSKLPKKNYLLLLRTYLSKDIVLSLIISLVAGSTGFMIFEVFTLLIISDKQHGGYNMTDQDIGFCYLIVGITELIYQFLLYSKLLKALGLRKLLMVGFVVFALPTFLFPWGSSIPITDNVSTDEWQNETIYYCDNSYNVTKQSDGNFIQRKPALVWIIVIIPFTILMIGRMTGIITSTILVNNASPSEIKGIVNGIAVALVSLFRAGGYSLAAIIFAWSQTNGKDWPLNYHFMFIVLTVILLCSLPLICSISKSVEKKKVGKGR